jgi:hypothetical protein
MLAILLSRDCSPRAWSHKDGGHFSEVASKVSTSAWWTGAKGLYKPPHVVDTTFLFCHHESLSSSSRVRAAEATKGSM